ncbi:MAG: PhzF family phenazine biosynthesis protein [Candidatus Meridianibacter frigidus]|nr:MAG: PhzF family phenazine biosynthesis protein [Candidatus Eremiobacteraeota bacterium]
MRLPFHQVDVFTTQQFKGNPLAVFPEGGGLDTATMQAIAREMNLSETTFVEAAKRPDCDFAVRIFTPGTELPFAGHPTIGTSFVLDQLGRLPADDFTFEMKAAPIPVRRECDAQRYWMTPPAAKPARTFAATATIAQALGLPVEALCGKIALFENGLHFFCVPLDSRASVDAAAPNRPMLAEATALDANQFDVVVFHYHAGHAYSRMLAHPASGITEDPATGSSVAPLVATLRESALLEAEARELTVEQGAKMGRRSTLHVHLGPPLLVGGGAVAVFESSLTL